jgi:hypothetical protein
MMVGCGGMVNILSQYQLDTEVRIYVFSFVLHCVVLSSLCASFRVHAKENLVYDTRLFVLMLMVMVMHLLCVTGERGVVG